jgi:beta-lactamase superfamily II metal-dependent hydrolase
MLNKKAYKVLAVFNIIFTLCFISISHATILVVKEGRNAILKKAPYGNAETYTERLSEGTKVRKIGEAPRYYSIKLEDGRFAWSYKGNFEVADAKEQPQLEANKANLLARSDVFKIIVIDVEVGDATLIFCPEEDGKRDVLLIDTGEDDGDRIKDILLNHGLNLSNKPITCFYATHYDKDHIGDSPELIPLASRVYDHGNNNIKWYYRKAVQKPEVDRRLMSLAYNETFSGGVTVECVAVNRATDFNKNIKPSKKKENPNSIALIISYDDFDYFTGGDLTFVSEKSLAEGIRNCDVYHVNHHGSRATSSDEGFVIKLDPEVSVVSNGTKYGHPTSDVAKRLINKVGSKFYQTNFNDDSKAHKPDFKYIADDTYYEDEELEDLEGATGNITIVVDSESDKYYVVMKGLPLNEAVFNIE